MKYLSKLMVFILSCVLLITLTTGCSSTGGSSDESSDEENVKIIKLWLHKAESDDEGKIYRALVDKFNSEQIMSSDGENTLRIKIEYKGTPDTLTTAISSEMLTGGLPDIIAVDASTYSAYQTEGVIVSIDDYITAEQKATYVDSVIEQSTIDGKLYGLSGMDAPGGLYCNKEIVTEDILAKANLEGYSTTENPWSWDDLVRILKVLKEEGKPYQIRLNLGFGGTEGCMYLQSPLVYSAGGSFAVNGIIYDGLTSDESVNGLQQLEKVLKNDGDSNFAYVGENADAFAQGEVPFQIFGPWDITTINKKYPEFNGKYDILPLPVSEVNGEKGIVATPCGSWGFAVTKDSNKVEDAAKVVAYLTGKDASRMLFQGIGTFPTNTELYNEIPEFVEDGPMKSLSELLINTAKPRPVLPNYPQLAMAYSNIIEYIETMVNEPDYDLKTFIEDKARAADEGL